LRCLYQDWEDEGKKGYVSEQSLGEFGGLVQAGFSDLGREKTSN